MKNLRPDSVMVGKDKPSFHASHHVTAITFLLIGVIIITTTSISFVFPLTLNQNHTAMAQQEQLYTGVTIRMASAFLIFDLNSLPF
jgi:hypothetical protein